MTVAPCGSPRRSGPSRLKAIETVTVMARPSRNRPGPRIALAMQPSRRGFVALIGQGRARAALLPEGVDWRALGLKAAAVRGPARASGNGGRDRADGPGPPTCRRSATAPHRRNHVPELAPTWPSGRIRHRRAGAVIGAGTRIGDHVSIVAAEAVLGGCLIHDGVPHRPGVPDRGLRSAAQRRHRGDGFSFVTEAPGRADAARSSLAPALRPKRANRVGRRSTRLAGSRSGRMSRSAPAARSMPARSAPPAWAGAQRSTTSSRSDTM